MSLFRNLALLAGRFFIAAVFIYDATLIARFATENRGYVESFGVPGFLLLPAGLFQFIGGLLIVIGLFTRITAIGFAIFCLLTALIFHHNAADVTEAIQFGKDLGLAAGFLFLAASGAGAWSLDARLGTDLWPFARA